MVLVPTSTDITAASEFARELRLQSELVRAGAGTVRARLVHSAEITESKNEIEMNMSAARWLFRPG